MSDESDIQQDEVSDVAWQLAEAFQELMEEFTADSPEELSEQVVGLSNQISQVERKQQQSLNDLESVKHQMDNFTSTNKLLENAGKANQLLGQEHYDHHIIEPMVRSLFPVLDLIEDAYKHWISSKQITELLCAVWSQMQQFLAVYDVHAIKHKPNRKFNPKEMKPIKWIPTDNSDFNGQVADSLRIGFRLGNERILRIETVALYKYQPSEINNVNILIKE